MSGPRPTYREWEGLGPAAATALLSLLVWTGDCHFLPMSNGRGEGSGDG